MLVIRQLSRVVTIIIMYVCRATATPSIILTVLQQRSILLARLDRRLQTPVLHVGHNYTAYVRHAFASLQYFYNADHCRNSFAVKERVPALALYLIALVGA
jgi:hypothetical protein